MRTRAVVTTAATLLLTLAAVSCGAGGGGSDPSNLSASASAPAPACAAIEQLVVTIDRIEASTANTPTSVRTQVTDLVSALRKLYAVAPPSIADDTSRMFRAYRQYAALLARRHYDLRHLTPTQQLDLESPLDVLDLGETSDQYAIGDYAEGPCDLVHEYRISDADARRFCLADQRFADLTRSRRPSAAELAPVALTAPAPARADARSALAALRSGNRAAAKAPLDTVSSFAMKICAPGS